MDRLTEPHIERLTAFTKLIRKERQGTTVPNFDPEDGGVDAKCLFVFQDPGPATLDTDFISRDNPDPTAEEFFYLNREARLCRKATASWNVVPWHVEAVDPDARQAGIKYLNRLLPCFEDLKLIVLAGKESQRAARFIYDSRPDALVLFMPHPAQRVLRRWPEKRQQISSVLELVARTVDSL